MNFIRRNIGIVIFCLLAAVVAVFLAFLIQRQATQAAEFQGRVEEQRNFFRDIKRRDVPVNQANLEIIKENHDLIEEKLIDLQNVLWNRTRISVEPVSGIEAKNQLIQATRNMQRFLEENGTIVSDDAANFSFAHVLEVEALPDRETEVPILLKQLQLIREIVQLAGESGISRLVRLNRPMGLEFEERQFFRFIPFEIVVEGQVNSVKSFVTKLQEDSAYLFAVQHSIISSGNEAGQLLQEGFGAEHRRAMERGREDMLRDEMQYYDRRMPDQPRVPRRSREMEQADEEEQIILPKEARQIGFANIIRVNLRIDFLDFNEPKQE